MFIEDRLDQYATVMLPITMKELIPAAGSMTVLVLLRIVAPVLV